MSEDARVAAVSPTPSTDIIADAPVARRCPWCSEALPEDATEHCPACRALLVAEGTAGVAGLTELDVSMAARASRAESPKRSRLLSWISGEIDEEPAGVAPSAPAALDPPGRDVRLEMLRLRLEAEGLTVAEDGTIALPVDGATRARAETAEASSAINEIQEQETPEAPEEIRRAS